MLKRVSIFNLPYTTRYGIAVLISGMLLLALVGSLMIWHFYKIEHKRSLLQWQVVLSLVAESREKEVNQWLEDQFKDITGLAENLSLKLYMTELGNGVAASDEEAASAEPDYLRILLQITSERSDFKPSALPEDLENNANLNKTAGIALLDIKHNIIASTRYMPPLSGKLLDFINNSKLGERNFLDIFTLSENNPPASENTPNTRMIAFLVPVFAVQGDRKPEDQIGYIIGVTEVNENLFSKLYQPGLPYTDSETLLVRKVDNFIEYISPLSGPPAGQYLRLNADTDNLDTAFLVASNGGFTEMNDYKKQDVLAAARKVDVAPWYVVHKVNSDVAFKSSRSRSRSMATILVLSTSLMLIVLFAVWRHASSLRAETSAKEYREIARRHAAQEKLLRLIADSQPDAVSILDESSVYKFANTAAADKAGMRPSEVVGKTIEAVLGKARAKKYVESSKTALQNKSVVSYMKREKVDGVTKVFQVQHIPLKEIPNPHSPESRTGTLIVEQDITGAIKLKNDRANILRRMVETITAVVDMRLPYFANHSRRVSKLAKLIAREMRLDRQMRETVEFAGKLINIGKIFTPEDLLTQQGHISPDEIQKIRKGAELSAELIKDIRFNGPVSEAIMQSNEKIDGSGPLRLKGDEIIMAARILAVANALVSMASNRPHRSSLERNELMKVLMADSGVKYDRSVVAALMHYLENGDNDNEWLFAQS